MMFSKFSESLDSNLNFIFQNGFFFLKMLRSLKWLTAFCSVTPPRPKILEKMKNRRLFLKIQFHSFNSRHCQQDMPRLAGEVGVCGFHQFLEGVQRFNVLLDCCLTINC